MKKKYIIIIGLFLMILLSSCKDDSIYTISFYDISSETSYIVGHTNEKVYSIDIKALEFNELPNGKSSGLIIFESDVYIGIAPYAHLNFSNEQKENQEYNYVYNTYLELTEDELVVTWYEKDLTEKVNLVEEATYFNVTLGYYPTGQHIFYYGAYELGTYDNLGNEMQNMFLYNYGSGFTISLDSGSTIATKFQFMIISIENTKDDVKVLLPSQYIGGVIKLDLDMTEKQIYSFENQEIELFATPHVQTTY
jgi:hypothetical protein